MERGVGESVFFLPFCSLTRTPHPPRPHLSFSLSFQLSHRLSWKGLPVGYKKAGTKNVSSFSECLILPFEFYTWSQSHLFVLIQTYRPFQSQPAFGDRFVQVTALLIVWHHARYSIGFASGIRSKLGGVSGNVGKMSLCNMGSALLQHSAKLAILHGGWKDSAVVDCCIFVSAQFASLFRFFFFLGWIFPCENL